MDKVSDEKVNQILNIVMWIAFILSAASAFFYQNGLFCIVMLVVGSWARIIQEKKLLIHIVTSKLFLWVMGIVFSVGYFLAGKLLNIFFQVENDYLNTSPWILAIFLSFILFFILLQALVIVFFVIALLFKEFNVTIKVTDKTKNNTMGHITWTLVCALIGIIPLLIAVSEMQHNVFLISIRMDAYSVSDCGPIRQDAAYLRINERQCYKFEPWISLTPPVVVESKKSG
ncbi:hypothetical protein [Morganella morganii]|uniref:hypothetical protein n=1 Tax=Morganella morganii TaxID=582 RepID=UPI000DCAE5A3|nr:hypothetical protein [Morganella morganii]MBT0412001.1 hypothetical protein [Morganella morganii subsp. morganii]MBV0430644.1 hypothetical protein [Morganella morganii subsp. morganii]RAX24999.1 hypothetical protein DQ401_18455 [Morganella morganii]WNP29097.1 hypothetical protein RN616_11175 [Morganella morganii]HCT2374302.1 hypothetical protein [Morganella morganii]